MTELKAIIFDMDGVLVNSEPYHIKVEKSVFNKLGIDVSEQEHAGYMGVATDMMWQQLIENRKLNSQPEALTRLTVDEGISVFKKMKKIEPMPGIIPLLETIKRHNLPMGVASSSDAVIIDIILKKSGLKDYFMYAVSSSDVGKSKPAPDVFLHTAKLLDANPINCMVIEDSGNGIKAAKSAGMFCVAYNGGCSENQDHSEADMVVGDFSYLEKFLIESEWKL